MNQKLTKLEKRWILYDVGNSAFVLLTSTIIPIYYKNIASASGISDSDSTAFFGYATSLVTILVAVLGPVLGTLADTKGFKKPVFTFFMMMGVLGCAGLALPATWVAFLAVYVLAKTGLNASLVFYDAMLPDVTTDERMDVVSAQGYAWGYIGSCIPFILSLLLVLFYESLGLTMKTAMGIAFFLVAVWWIAMSVPLLKSYTQTHYQIVTSGSNLAASFRRLGGIFSELKERRKVLFFLLAFFFYIDGVYTIIDMATAYGTALGLDSTGLLLALLVTQIVAFPAALIFGRLSRKAQSSKLIMVCIGAYFLVALYGIILEKQYQFWILAVVVGMFQGAIQSLSRSYFVKIIPANKSGEFFGLYDICGKGASFAGTMLVSIISQLSGSVNLGVGALSVMFLIGFLLFLKADRM